MGYTRIDVRPVTGALTATHSMELFLQTLPKPLAAHYNSQW